MGFWSAAASGAFDRGGNFKGKQGIFYLLN